MPRHRPIPPDVLERFGQLPDHVYRGKGEHSSSCPNCGGARGGRDPSDRFRFWEREAGMACNFWCRRCGFSGFTDDNKPGHKPTEKELKEFEELRRRQAELEEKRMRRKIEAIREAAYWKGWHDAMGEREREIWERRGVCRYLQDYYSLGYMEEYSLYYDDEQIVTPALTIPHYRAKWDLVNIQYRLQQAPKGVGKYRQTAGLPVAMFDTEPEEELSGAALILEGAIKSIVLYQHLGRRPLGFELSIVGLPSLMMPESMIEQLSNCEPIYLGLDPDAFGVTQDNGESAVKRAIKLIGRDRVRLVSWPIKPDDMIVEYGADADLIKNYIRDAQRV